MAKILSCQDLGLECDYLCANSEEELFNRAAQYAKRAQSLSDVPLNFASGCGRPCGTWITAKKPEGRRKAALFFALLQIRPPRQSSSGKEVYPG